MKKLICWFFGHKHYPIIDTEARRSFQQCWLCGHEFQYDFQQTIPDDWVGYMIGENQCSICLGWKPRAWKFCSSSYCELNPRGHRQLY